MNKRMTGQKAHAIAKALGARLQNEEKFPYKKTQREARELSRKTRRVWPVDTATKATPDIDPETLAAHVSRGWRIPKFYAAILKAKGVRAEVRSQ